MITEDYVSFEVAKLLKEKEFDWECLGTYSTGDRELSISSECPYSNDLNDDMFIAAPTLQMAMKYLREVYDIIICIEPHTYNVLDNKTSSYIFTYWTEDNYNEPYCWQDETNSVFGKSWSTYEEAAEAAIKYCLTDLI